MRNPADHNEVGKLITVIKNTGAGISKERMKESLDENEGKSSGLLTAKRLSSYLGGSLQINSLHDVGTQVTFEVQCTYYPVRNFKIDVLKETNTKKEKSVLFLPL
jgi:LytS/YehU family sensor histidine kinase